MKPNSQFVRYVLAFLCVMHAAAQTEPKKVDQKELLEGVYTYTHLRGIDSACIAGFESDAVLEMVNQAKKEKGGKEFLLLTSLRRAVTDLKLTDQVLKAARDQLYASLNAGDAPVRQHTLMLVTDLDGKKATDILLKAVDDTDSGVQATALYLLEKYGDPASVGRLEEVLKNRDAKRNTPQALDESAHFKNEAATALEQLKERAAKEQAGKKPPG